MWVGGEGLEKDCDGSRHHHHHHHLNLYIEEIKGTKSILFMFRNWDSITIDAAEAIYSIYLFLMFIFCNLARENSDQYPNHPLTWTSIYVYLKTADKSFCLLIKHLLFCHIVLFMILLNKKAEQILYCVKPILYCSLLIYVGSLNRNRFDLHLLKYNHLLGKHLFKLKRKM